jgi:hypothetical protein
LCRLRADVQTADALGAASEREARPGRRIAAPTHTTPARGHALYQINTRVWLGELAQTLGRPATVDDVSDASLDRIVAHGFDWLWLLGIWQTGDAGRALSRSRAEWRDEYREALPDFALNDIHGSPFAVTEYVVHRDFGGPGALERFRTRLSHRRINLMLDFVSNHTALDHGWVRAHPEFYIHGTADDVAREPQNYWRIVTPAGARVLAHGRDPYFPAWADTVQLNYRHPQLRKAMLEVLETIAAQCDGVRCDMAMLVLPEVSARTWGERARPADGAPPVDDSFWPAAIAHVRRRRPDFVFLAEAYWDLEWTLQRQGFDYTYDKRLYDRLRAQDVTGVRAHLTAALEYQRRSVRFLENHDEPRAAAAFPLPVHRAAAVVTFLVPGLRFVHEGQLVGRRVRTSNHLGRRAAEPVDREIEEFYARLLAVMRRPDARDGDWRLLDVQPAWDGNPTWERFIAFAWQAERRRLLVAVNYGGTPGQCVVRLPWADLDGRAVVLQDIMTPSRRYERDGGELSRRGLHVDLSAWDFHVLDVDVRAR